MSAARCGAVKIVCSGAVTRCECGERVSVVVMRNNILASCMAVRRWLLVGNLVRLLKSTWHGLTNPAGGTMRQIPNCSAVLRMLRRSDRHGSERKHCSEIEERGGGGRWAGERLGVCRRTLVSSAAASMCSEALRNSSFRRTVGGGRGEDAKIISLFLPLDVLERVGHFFDGRIEHRRFLRFVLIRRSGAVVLAAQLQGGVQVGHLSVFLVHSDQHEVWVVMGGESIAGGGKAKQGIGEMHRMVRTDGVVSMLISQDWWG